MASEYCLQWREAIRLDAKYKSPFSWQYVVHGASGPMSPARWAREEAMYLPTRKRCSIILSQRRAAKCLAEQPLARAGHRVLLQQVCNNSIERGYDLWGGSCEVNYS